MFYRYRFYHIPPPSNHPNRHRYPHHRQAPDVVHPPPLQAPTVRSHHLQGAPLLLSLAHYSYYQSHYSHHLYSVWIWAHWMTLTGMLALIDSHDSIPCLSMWCLWMRCVVVVRAGLRHTHGVPQRECLMGVHAQRMGDVHSHPSLHSHDRHCRYHHRYHYHH